MDDCKAVPLDGDESVVEVDVVAGVATHGGGVVSGAHGERHGHRHALRRVPDDSSLARKCTSDITVHTVLSLSLSLSQLITRRQNMGAPRRCPVNGRR